MPDVLTVKTSGLPVMGDEQAKYFAISIFTDMKRYISEHRAEFEEWQREQQEGEPY